MAKLTKAQRARLDKLATYLEGLPADYRHFEMEDFVVCEPGFKAEKSVADYARTNGGVQSCGTAACAVGHGPAAGILVPPRFVVGSGIVNWSAYCQLFIGDDDEAEDFLFGGNWTWHDNHHHGAAARIRYLLANGVPPVGWTYADMIPLYAPYRIDAKAPANA